MKGAGPTKVWLLAHPAGHSLSPRMHGAAFAAMGLVAEYAALDVPPAELAAAFERLRRPDVLGANVTVPHKQAALRLVDRVEPEAAALGAVNTVVNEDGVLVGSNTDGPGFVAGLLELAPELAAGGFEAVVLGAGGAARAVAWALARLGASVAVANRDPGRALRMVAELTDAGAGPGPLRACPTAEALRHWPDLLVNTTSVGMAGGPAPDGLPLLTRADLTRLRPGAVVSDLVYRPAVTPLLAAANELGVRTQNGVAMLVGQGALSLRAWTGREAPVGVMLRAVEEALKPPPAVG